MGAHLRAHVEGEFHFVERLLEIRRQNGMDHNFAFVTLDLGAVCCGDDAI